MKKIALLLCVLLLVTACGGGGGGVSPTLWPASSTTSGTSTIGTLSASDIVAPDGSFVDLYTFVVANAGEYRIRLESASFDTYLWLLQDVDLTDPDLLTTNWVNYLVTENDDYSGSTFNSEVVVTLTPGTYTIAANSFDPATSGDYTLTVAALDTFAYLQNRTVEGNPSGFFQGWIEFKENGQPLQASDIQSIRVLNPNNVEVTPVSDPTLVPNVASMITADWNAATSQFESIATYDWMGFLVNLSNYGVIPTGAWTYEVQPADGAVRNVSVNFPSLVDLTPIAAASMTYVWNPDGSLTLNWVDTAEVYDLGRILFYDASGAELFNGEFQPGVSEVTLPASLVQLLNQTGSLPSPTTISWRQQTRIYEAGGNNYTRSISGPVSIAWP
jgi:hypothetical protein